MSKPMSETSDERRARLEVRLADGFQKIGEAMSRGVEVQNWERHWVELLREYEAISDELAAHHAEVRQQAELAGMPRREQAA